MAHVVSKSRLRRLFDYEDGCLIRIALTSKMSNKEYVGQKIGTMGSHGYLSAMVDMKTFKVSRLVWIWHYGDIGPNEIDHINGNTADNRIENLRCVSKQENLRNKKRYASNKSGVSGVTWYTPLGKWLSRISVNGKRVSLGYFDNLFDAACARKSAELTNGFHVNHGNR